MYNLQTLAGDKEIQPSKVLSIHYFDTFLSMCRVNHILITQVLPNTYLQLITYSVLTLTQ